MKIFGYDITSKKIEAKTVVPPKTPVSAVKKKNVVALPPGRVSTPNDLFTDGGFQQIKRGVTIVKPKFYFEFIPVIRNLYKYNGDVGQVLNDLIQLTNTGHQIKFDQSIKADRVDEMRAHLYERKKEWGNGVAGLDGLINKMIAQIWVAGALSIEAYPNYRLTQVENVSLVNPETIRFSILKKGKYSPYQKINKLTGKGGDYVKLNTKTFLYYGMLGDEDNPYGVPPFMTALEALSTQKDMNINMKHILNQMGLLGYLEVKIAKPSQNTDESLPAYETRLTRLLVESKNNTLKGFKDGIVVGYEDDHDFDFHSTTKNLNGVGELFNLNENQIANGLKTPPAFIGGEQQGGEGQLGIVFTKMISQLKSVQNILSFALEHIYKMELALAGYDTKGLKVEFSQSTITDDMKWQQAREIKQRVSHNLWVDGIIGQEAYADEMGYQKPDRTVEAPAPGMDSSGSDAKKKEDREKDKDKSDRKGRDKDKAQPKRKDRDTKTK